MFSWSSVIFDYYSLLSITNSLLSMMIIYYSHHHYFLFIDYLLLLSYYIYIYIPYYPILSPCVSFMIIPWISSSKKIRQVLQLETAMGAAIQCPDALGESSFSLGKRWAFRWNMWENYGKWWANMGKLWKKMGRYGIMMGKLKYLLGGWWFAPVFVAYNVS